MAVKSYEVQIPRVFSYDSVRDKRIFILEAFVRFHVKMARKYDSLLLFPCTVRTDTLNKFLL
jgi:hypothetical protein